MEGVEEINVGATADRCQHLKGLEARESVVDDEEGIWSTRVTGGDQSDVLTYGQVDEVNSRPINETPIETLFRVKFTSLSDIDVFTNSIKEGKYADILSTMSTANITHLPDSYVIRQDQALPSDPIVLYVDITTKFTSYVGVAGASTKEQPNFSSNFHPLVADPVFNCVNISIPRKVVEKKEALTRIPIWVKLHDVPLQIFEDDGIILIATFIRKPIMLDSYTSSMCMDSWGRSSFARCLIEVNSEADLVDVVTISIPSLTGDEFTKETIRVEYEWRPPRCDECKVFGHIHDHCPKKVKKRKGKSKSTNGDKFASPSVKQTVRYEPKETPSAPKKGTTNVRNLSKLSSMLKTTDTSPKKDNFTMSNSFSALNDEEGDDEEVENVYDESANLFKSGGSSSFTVAAG
ncbi:zinc knuckle CX2CX4HX4C containing protein [Tanacetum coccineum]|uniref:Zinc knuckle CX2CX4HX4C containing protein n=1 Tax=Tanacetum coccineum TaxID=301880 RepID=A0ABQ5BFK2_9ASTR